MARKSDESQLQPKPRKKIPNHTLCDDFNSSTPILVEINPYITNSYTFQKGCVFSRILVSGKMKSYQKNHHSLGRPSKKTAKSHEMLRTGVAFPHFCRLGKKKSKCEESAPGWDSSHFRPLETTWVLEWLLVLQMLDIRPQNVYNLRIFEYVYINIQVYIACLQMYSYSHMPLHTCIYVFLHISI